jgi:glycerophosphoryl diester phosphodiesterase
MTVIVAHRGASRQAPENTLEAFRLAVEAGADAIELDVHLTADGDLAVIHDPTLDRTTDRGGVVAEMPMAEIQQADAGWEFTRDDDSGFAFRGRGLRVPTLREVLEWLPDGTGIVVEIKARAAVDGVVEALRDTPAYRAERASVISFDEHAIDRARELDRSLPTGYLLVPSDSFERGVTWATEHGHPAVHPWEGDLGPDPGTLVALATAYGRQVGCYVVNDPARMLTLRDAGVWGFVTDVPDVAVATLRGSSHPDAGVPT